MRHLVTAAGLTRPSRHGPYDQRVQHVARLVPAYQLAALIMADPRRWWPVVSIALTTPPPRDRTAPPQPVAAGPVTTRGFTVQAPPGAARRISQEEWDRVIESLAEADLRRLTSHFETVNKALASEIRHLTRLAAAGRVAEAEEVWLHGDPLHVRDPLEERLVWLLDHATGPGFETVLGVLADHSEPKIRRRVAKHTQAPAPLWMEMFNDDDRWVRFGATDQLGRSLNFAAGSDDLAGPNA